MNCCRHKYFVIYRGDDTDFPGNQELIVELNTTLDLTGCSAHFSFQGFTQDFDEIPSDKKLRLVIPNSATGKFALGAADAKLWLTNGTKVRTVENRIHIVVTNRVDEAYNNDDPQAITVTISGGGGGATVVLDDTVTAESTNGVKSSGIWAWVKSLLPSWLTAESEEPATVASVANKRNKDDIAVYEEQLGPWTHGKLVEGYEITEEQPQHDSSLWFWFGAWSDESGGHYTSVAQAPFVSEDQTNIVFTVDAHPSGVPSGFTFTATRTTSIGTKPNQQLAAVATGDAQAPSDGDLVKYDAANERFVMAIAGRDYIKSHQDISGKQDKILETGILKGGGAGAILPAIPSSSAGETADYRDPLDNTCHKTTSVAGEWSTVTKDGDVWSVHRLDSPGKSEWVLRSNGIYYPNASTKDVGDDTATTLTWVGGGVDWDKDFDITFTRTFTTLASKDHAFVTADIAARSLECGDGDAKQTVTVENGVAKLDDFFKESNTLLNGRLAYNRNTTGLKDRAFNTLSFDGTEFNLSTALAAVTPTASGQPRDLLIVATATAATTISFTAGTIKGDKPTIDGAGTWLITLTEYAANTWYCRQIKMEDAA